MKKVGLERHQHQMESFELRQLWVTILALPLSSYVILPR